MGVVVVVRPENWKELNPMEKAAVVQRYVNEIGRAEAARVLGISREYIGQLLALLKLPPEVQEKLKRKEIGIYDAFKLFKYGATRSGSVQGDNSQKNGVKDETYQLREKLSAFQEKNKQLMEENERLAEENRRLRNQLSRNQETMVVINRLQKIFVQLEKKEEEVRSLLRGVTVSGAHRMEVLRWMSLLKRLEKILEESLATLDAEYVDAEGHRVQ
ncbi:MAG: hypothetical protein ACPLRU_08060, partial [Desulfofundulus sp.]